MSNVMRVVLVGVASVALAVGAAVPASAQARTVPGSTHVSGGGVPAGPGICC
jgi:hypothetical protein